jgi:hypothetical protein
MVFKNRANCLLILLKYSDYRYYLNNRTAISKALDVYQHRHQAYNKHWALTFFELQDNQVYRKAEHQKDGTVVKAQYAACTYDTFELIYKAYYNLYYTGK